MTFINESNTDTTSNEIAQRIEELSRRFAELEQHYMNLDKSRTRVEFGSQQSLTSRGQSNSRASLRSNLQENDNSNTQFLDQNLQQQQSPVNNATT